MRLDPELRVRGPPCHSDAGGEACAWFLDMSDDADDGDREGFDRPRRGIERLGIKRAESLIDKEAVQGHRNRGPPELFAHLQGLTREAMEISAPLSVSAACSWRPLSWSTM
jgi:hypothetical protein